MPRLFLKLTSRPPSIARYSSIQLSELGRCEENGNPQASKRYSNPGSLDCESVILLLSHYTPLLSIEGSVAEQDSPLTVKLLRGSPRPCSGFARNPKNEPLSQSTKYRFRHVLICSPAQQIQQSQYLWKFDCSHFLGEILNITFADFFSNSNVAYIYQGWDQLKNISILINKSHKLLMTKSRFVCILFHLMLGITLNDFRWDDENLSSGWKTNAAHTITKAVHTAQQTSHGNKRQHTWWIYQCSACGSYRC